MVRDPRRIDDVLLAIGEVWAKNPDLRLGQLLINAVRPAEPCPAVFSIEDRDLVRRLRAEGEDLRQVSESEPHVEPDCQLLSSPPGIAS